MLLQVLADAEGVAQAAHEFLLALREHGRMLRVDSGEICVAQGVAAVANETLTRGKIYVFEQGAVEHIPLRVGMVSGAFQFKLNHAHSLVHLCQQAAALLVGAACGVFNLWQIGGAGVGIVGFHGKRGQWQQVDGVAFLQRLGIGIAQGEAKHAGYAERIASRSTHPQNVVVAPLYVPVVVGREGVHNEVRTRTAVEDVAQNV